jgi:hypothetical protein
MMRCDGECRRIFNCKRHGALLAGLSRIPESGDQFLTGGPEIAPTQSEPS